MPTTNAILSTPLFRGTGAIGIGAVIFSNPITHASLSLQHVTDLGDILGAEDLTSQKYIAALTLAFKSFRCYYLSESYVVRRKWAEAVGLLDRALEHVTQSLEQYRSLGQGAVSVNVKVDQEKVSSV